MSTTVEGNNERCATLPSPLCFNEARGLFKVLVDLERVRKGVPVPTSPCRIPVAVEDNKDEGGEPAAAFSTRKPRESSDQVLQENEEDRGNEVEDNNFPMEAM